MQTTANYGLKKPDGADTVSISDLNYNADQIDVALTPTADPTQTPTSNGPGKLVQWVSWIANRIKAITGKANWWEAPATTLEAAKAHIDAAAPHSGHAPMSHVGAGGSAHAVATASAAGFMSASDKSKLDSIQAGAGVNQNAFSQIRVGTTTIYADTTTDVLELAAGDGIILTPDAANDKVTIGVRSSNFTPASHMGSRGSAHAEATTSVAGFMSAADKAKLNGLGRVSVVMGTISHGATLPLPSGYAQNECWWIVSNNNSDTGGDAIGGLRIWVDPSTRVVTAQRRMEYNLSLQNITANYLVIGVKPS